MSRRVWALGGTVAAFALIPGNGTKLAAMAALWAWSLLPLRRGELLLMLTADVIFTLNDALAVRAGAFRFLHPDILGVPVWECFVWGYYLVEAQRSSEENPASGWDPACAWLGLPFAASFALPSQAAVLGASAGCVAAMLWRWHSRRDLRNAAFMVGLGAVVEHAGVWSGQWAYPAPYPTGVAPWFVFLFAGVGLLNGRIAPALRRLEDAVRVKAVSRAPATLQS